ncbi:Predicted phosphoribosyltransferase [Pseudonocardia ammonioxydans]|uniref:Predicted phosphoribosyltransferase n=2 Tax=Pseudonocardia ammonioxydans TaxID=260086 RepID=A0A1I5ILC0_PSUAM|nr:Predicted phosphoribosyltransferase [Pseudonocardia ammonioxydans]
MPMATGFRNRTDAGRRLARLVHEHDLPDPVVLGLPRGGVPVAAEVASALRAPLEVFVARKLGAPGHPELGIGAIAEGGGLVVDRSAVEFLELTDDDVAALAAPQWQELERRVRLYRGERGLPDLAGRDVVVVDDGLATGVTAEAALRALREQRPRTLVLAVPACAASTVQRLRGEADEVLCALTPPDFTAVGRWYEDFTQTSDAEVLELLGRGAPATGGAHR